MPPRKPHPWWAAARAAARADTRADLRGGITAGLLTLVTAISYAAVAGAPLGAGMTSAVALSGLIGAAVGGLVAACLSPVKPQVFSPRASVAVVIAAAAATIDARLGPGSVAQTLSWLSACLLLASLMQAGFGLLRMGALIRLIPHCVTAGFMVGIAIEMAWSQWPHLMPTAAARLEAVAPLAIGLACVGAIAWVQWHPRWRHLRGWAMPIGLVVAVLFCEGLQGTLSWTVPHLRAVEFTSAPFVSLMQALGVARELPASALLPEVLVFALVIAFINSIETLTCVLALETRLQQRFDANRALIASAAGSLAAVCLGGLPVAGGTAASMANVEAGARSRGSAVTAAVTVALLAAIGHGVIGHIPLAAVAGVVLTVAFALALVPVREMALQRRAAGSELAVAALVALLLLTAGSAVALLCGVLAVSVLAVMQMRRHVVRREYDASQPPAADGEQRAIDHTHGQQIRVLEVGQPLLFATVESLVQAVEAHRQTARFVVLDLTHVSAVDASAARALASCAASMAALGQALVIVRSSHTSHGAAALCAIEGCALFDRVDDALKHCAAGPLTDRAAPDERRETPAWSEPETLTDEARATQLLLPHVGPIARILVKQAQARSTDCEQLYRLLAQHLPDPRSSRAFLSAAGLGDEPPSPGAFR